MRRLVLSCLLDLLDSPGCLLAGSALFGFAWGFAIEWATPVAIIHPAANGLLGAFSALFGTLATMREA